MGADLGANVTTTTQIIPLGVALLRGANCFTSRHKVFYADFIFELGTMMLTWGAQIRPHPTLAIALILTTCEGEVAERATHAERSEAVQTQVNIYEVGDLWAESALSRF